MRTLVKTALLVSLIPLLFGCDAVLEQPEPSTSISQEVALTNPDAVQGVRASMYDWFHDQGAQGAISTDWQLGPSALADNTVWRAGEARHQGLNLYDIRGGGGIGTDAYDEFYAMINDANLLINGIQTDELSDAEKRKLEAEGRFIRALALHRLVRVFGYDPAGPDPGDGLVQPNSGPGQNFDLGVVIRTEPTLSPDQATEKARNTVHEVYDQIQSDLEQASNLFSNLPSDVKEMSRHYPSEAAAQALLARVHLYQRNWSAANNAAQNAIDLAGSTLGSSLAEPSELMDIFDETSGGNPEAIFQIRTVNENASNGINISLSTYLSTSFLAQLPTQDLIDLYGQNDARLDTWYGPCFIERGGQEASGCEQRNDEGLEIRKYQSERGISAFADDYQITRVAEMVLIQAEARLHTTGANAAISRLNDLREKRNASTLNPSNFDQASALDEILDERRRELFVEGHRFFDLKRLGRDIPKDHIDGVDDIPFNSHRILDDLPASQLDVNTELVQNPGW